MPQIEVVSSSSKTQSEATRDCTRVQSERLSLSHCVTATEREIDRERDRERASERERESESGKIQQVSGSVLRVNIIHMVVTLKNFTDR